MAILHTMNAYKGEVKTIQLRSHDGKSNNPFYCGLGVYVDIEDNEWDVNAVIGSSKDEFYVCARLNTNLEKTWIPYLIDIVIDE